MRTWVVVCDASKGRLFHSPGNIKKLSLIEDLEHPASRAKGSDLVTSRPGSAKKQAGVHGGFPPNTPPKEIEEERFAIQIAHLLNKKRAEKAFERLILVAPPNFMGTIQKHLDPSVKKQIAFSIKKNLTHLQPQEIAPSIEKYL